MVNKIYNYGLSKVRAAIFNLKSFPIRYKLKFCGKGVRIQMPVSFHGLRCISIDDDTSIAAFVHMWGWGEIVIGKRVMIASNSSITTITHDYHDSKMNKTIVLKKIVIEDDVWVGANSVIMPGVTLGKGCVIGAGSVVTKDVPPMQIVAGVPARFVKMREIWK
jgi:acetyltransferase-like isoleucine patch superfamily enzyme